jgi:hypothetical protein
MASTPSQAITATTATIYYHVYMDTEEQSHFMMKTMSGRNNSVLTDIGATYNVHISPCYDRHVFKITGNRMDIIRAHECLSRAYARRKKWVRSKFTYANVC